MSSLPSAHSNSKASLLPSEVLGEIFLACIPAIGNSDDLPAYFPYIISHVCRHWRFSALAFPKLWSFLDVGQTEENQEGDSAELSLMKAYLERSGNHPLTFRLAYEREPMHYQTFPECLEEHTARWQNVLLQGPNYHVLKHFAQGEPSDYPLLRSLALTYCEFDSEDAVHDHALFSPIPSLLAQLERYHEYEVSWTDFRHQWVILVQLTNVVDLRVDFTSDYEIEDEDEDEGEYTDEPVVPFFKMPRLRFASLANHTNALGMEMKDILNYFDFPCIQGLNLKLVAWDALSPVPDQLKRLKILRLCGSFKAISNADLLSLLTEIETLTDLAVELRCVDSAYLFGLLSVVPDSSVLAPQLRALRTTDYKHIAGAALDALLRMLPERFGGVHTTRLQRFEFFLGARPFVYSVTREEWATKDVTSTMFEDLESLREREGWDICVDKDWLQYDFWREEMDGEFL
ncbi:hypothetical protein B0H12DRAFT_215247 [Mycena haematopus]|nr:hypothetical protein B0H12DRAFT_215247 [Mycena haematopus]